MSKKKKISSNVVPILFDSRKEGWQFINVLEEPLG